MNVIVNPLATVESIPETGELIAGGPVPGRGMRALVISPTERPHLFELFGELSAIGLAHLDVGSDLRDGDVELLLEYGVLVEGGSLPERPLFSCMLADVEPAARVPDSLVVNSTVEFQPFDLTKFRTWIQERHFSPHHATVWATDRRSGGRWGYWLTPAEAEVVRRLEPGMPPPTDLDLELTARLVAACIFADPSQEVDDNFADAALKFANDRYVTIADVVPRAQLYALQSYMRGYVEQGFMRFGDDQVDRRFAAHGEAVASMFHEALLPLMQTLVGAPIRRTYAYSAVYDEGAELLPHIDREACEYSFSFQVDYEPPQADGVSPWAIYLADNEPGDLTVDPAKDLAILLPNGGLLAYRGRELVHYRTPLPQGHRSTSLFFHYVPA